jgi:hypothetical protein
MDSHFLKRFTRRSLAHPTCHLALPHQRLSRYKKGEKMSSKKLLNRMFGLTLVALLLAGCGGLSTEPSPTPNPTNTLAPTSTSMPTNTPTPAIFAIDDFDAFPVYDVEGCGGFVVIDGVEDGALQVAEAEIQGMSDAALDRMWEYYWCNGIEHTWIGEITYNSYTISSASDNPLVFSPNLEKGYLHIGGSGTVTMPDGIQVELTK